LSLDFETLNFNIKKSPHMFFKRTFRSLVHHKTTSLINITGLTVGIAAALLIGCYVLNEWQTDRWLPQPDRTYRLLRVSEINREPYTIGITSSPFGPALEQDFSADVAQTMRVLPGNSLVKVGEERFQEEHYYYVDPDFLTFFGLSLLHGNAATALARPHSIVLTRETARRYFGSEAEAMGQSLRIDNDYLAQVTGVLDELPGPIHLEFDLLESNISLREASWWTEWWNNNQVTYLRLNRGASAAALEERLPQFMDKYFGKDFAAMGKRMDLLLQPLRSVYFQADTRYDPIRHGNRQAVNIFLLSALLLIGIACANYVNLSTAKAAERSREMGISKILGSGRGRLIRQVLGESLLLTAFSVTAAAALTVQAIPWFEQWFGLSLNLQLSGWGLLTALAGLTAAITLLAGAYPAWLLASFRPVEVLNGSTTAGGRRTAGFRKALVVFQFALSFGLLCSTFVIQRQLQYLQEKNLGFDKEHVLLLRVNNPELYNKRDVFKERLLRQPGVQDVSFSSGSPGGFHDATSVKVEGIEETMRMRIAFVDFDYVPTYDLQMVAGRPFSREFASDSSRAVLLNERAVQELGMTPEQIIGTRLQLVSFDSLRRTVVGVVRDYHFSSLHDAVEPLVMAASFGGTQIAVKAQGDRLPEVIAAAEQAWTEQAPAFPFRYRFLDEQLDRLYQSEARQGRIFAFFAGIAIFIACLGMFGLAAYAASLRVKEIGIRKVVGATVSDIVVLLYRDFLKLVVIAILVAAPVAWYFIRDWLSEFAYHIDIEWWVFMLAGILAISIAMLTISFQSVRAALANPVESLRDE
jgi:putative ABC transport system permease protein